MKRERERIGPFVLTGGANLSPSGIVCAHCNKQLSVFDPAADKHTPSPEELARAGAVAVPNFGWFCCQQCGRAYETELGVRFQRDAAGLISNYGQGE
jgi:hypothetical protein